MVKRYRILGSFLAAIVVVSFLMTAALRIYGLFDEPEEDGLVAHPVELLDEFQRAELAAELGEDRPPPDPEEVQRLELPGLTTRSQLRGFVELEVMVGDDGSVDQVKVLNAFPRGVYEQQAIEEVSKRQFEPAVPGSAAETRIEIVEFSVAEDTG
ncbi:MAG: TonB family protein [Proteobacteria bacterium]|nr:TonB family protein [Pseudomonadota bacterium]